MVETIRHDGDIIAIIIYGSYTKNGIEFFTPGYFSQQLGYMNRPKGYKIAAHTHRIVERTVTLTQEVLFIKTGKVKISLYNNNQEFLSDQTLQAGDIILLATGGHAVEMLEESEIIKVKQGPYSGIEDKVGFIPNA